MTKTKHVLAKLRKPWVLMVVSTFLMVSSTLLMIQTPWSTHPPFPRATRCGAHRVSQGGFFAEAYGSTQGFLQAQPFFWDSVCVNMGGSFQKWNGYKKPMAYRKVLRCTTQKQWIAEVVRFIIIIVIIVIINEWANGGRDASEMTWKNPCTTGRMNQWTNESTSQWINKWVN